MEKCIAEPDEYQTPIIDPEIPGSNELLSMLGVGGVFRLPARTRDGMLVSLGYCHRAKSADDVVNALIVPQEYANEFPVSRPDVTVREWNDDRYIFHGNHNIDELEGMKQRFLFNRPRTKQPNLQSQPEMATSSASNIHTSEAARIIAAVEPEHCLFYTGAGISAFNSFGVWTFQTFVDKLELSESSSEKAFCKNRLFAESFLDNSEYAQRRLQLLSEFMTQLATARPWNAHLAIAGIMHYLGNKPLMATTNIDGLHQRTGLDVPYITRDHAGNPKTYLEKHRQFDEALRSRASSLKLVVTIGRSSDSRGLLQTVRRQSPEVRLMSFNVEPEAYLRERDYLVAGDCNVTIPQVLGRLANTELSKVAWANTAHSALGQSVAPAVEGTAYY